MSSLSVTAIKHHNQSNSRKQNGLLWVRVTMGQSPPWQGNVAAGMSDQPGRQDTQESHAIHAQEAEREIRK